MAVKSKQILLHDVMLLLGKQHASLSWETEDWWSFFIVSGVLISSRGFGQKENNSCSLGLGVLALFGVYSELKR